MLQENLTKQFKLHKYEYTVEPKEQLRNGYICRTVHDIEYVRVNDILRVIDCVENGRKGYDDIRLDNLDVKDIAQIYISMPDDSKQIIWEIPPVTMADIDIKQGDVAILRNGYCYMMVEDKLHLIDSRDVTKRTKRVLDLAKYNDVYENLEHSGEPGYGWYDVMAVYRPYYNTFFDKPAWLKNNLIWERIEDHDKK